MSTQKIGLIFGITGQDGSFLAEILLEKNYIVHGVIRMSSINNTGRIKKLLENKSNFFLHYGDLSDSSSIENIICKVKPDEVYNLAAMSHVRISFDIPEYSSNIDALGPLRLLDVIRRQDKPPKFYQAGTSELYGGIQSITSYNNEKTPFYPKSPYAISKLYAYWITINYREAYGLFAVNGILHNHTSTRRGDSFVEKKIIKGAVNILKGKQDCLYLGNLYSIRDIGHAKDFCNAIYLMMQNKIPKDYVIATGKCFMIKDIVNIVFEKLNMKIEWKGEGINEIGYINSIERIKINKEYFRPTEVNTLLGDASLAMKELGWKPTYTFEQIIDEMIEDEKKKS